MQDCGTLWRLNPVTLAFTVLHTFDAMEGCQFNAGPTLGLDGRLYVVGVRGGRFDDGAIVRIDPSATP